MSPNWILALGAIVVIALVAVAFVAVPYWIARGTFGKTVWDKPGFSVVAVHLSKEGGFCYIRSTVSNTGNVYIAKLTLDLNETYVFSDGWIPPQGLDDNWQRFFNYGSFHCDDVQVNQTYTASYLAQFADGVNQTASAPLTVGQYALPAPP